MTIETDLFKRPPKTKGKLPEKILYHKPHKTLRRGRL